MLSFKIKLAAMRAARAILVGSVQREEEYADRNVHPVMFAPYKIFRY